MTRNNNVNNEKTIFFSRLSKTILLEMKINIPKGRLKMAMDICEELQGFCDNNTKIKLNYFNEKCTLSVFTFLSDSLLKEDEKKILDGLEADISCYKNMLDNFILEGENYE